MEKLDRYLSIVTHVIAIVAIVPILLVMTGNSYFQNVFKIRTAEVMGVKGYTYYEPASDNHSSSQSWLLANNSADASLGNLKRGDVLVALHEANIRIGPSSNSRRAYFVPKNDCIIILKPDAKNTNSDGGGWVYVGTSSCN